MSIDAAAPDVPPLRGLGVSPGIAQAPVLHMAPPVDEPSDAAPLDPADRATCAEQVRRASGTVRDDLAVRARAAEGQARLVLEAIAAMAADPMLIESAVRRVEQDGASAARAVWLAAAEIETALLEAGPPMSDRVSDLHDVRHRIVCILLGRPSPGVPTSDAPFVLIAHDLAPADTVGLDSTQVAAIVTEVGGPTGHTAILARGMGLPAVIGAPGATELPAGQVVRVDGTTGTVELSADGASTITPRRAGSDRFTEDGRTADGHRVLLLANIEDPAAADLAVEVGAEGIGLFRTELCFLGRTTAPSVSEQESTYHDVLSRFPGRRVVVRTLDAGSDKPLPFVSGDDEPNPALGVRGFRTHSASPDVLVDQLDALASAARRADADVWVMAPMVSTPEEARSFVDTARGRGLRSVGVMVEVPAMAIQADLTAQACDFLSIGTNDLTQYVMAADRQLNQVASLNDPWQPAVLRLIQETAQAGTRHDTPVSVCGEAAADADLACVLVGLGLSSLSMTPRAIPRVGARLAGVTLAACRDAAAAALASPTAEQAARAAREALTPTPDPSSQGAP
ncbi:phosphoenolpyruvate--protein phosphotransferase [Aeromicrobium sp. CTD01-1L150]|uniref:phosphoenolpyruvate--protein phosphotransferase n=1 Tax=Aeromicrobium sp. CTD01-1L150 TaxID=3341830 RepID=UPI0035C2500C